MYPLYFIQLLLFVITIQVVLDDVDSSDVDLAYDLPLGSERKAAKKYVDVVYEVSSGERGARRSLRLPMTLFKALRNGGPEKMRIKTFKVPS